MQRSFRKLKLLISLELQRFAQYRGDLFVYMMSSVVLPLVLLNIWLTLAETKGSGFAEQSYLVEYFLVQIVINLLTSSWHGTYLGQRIKIGEISPFLLKPYEYIWYNVASNIAEKIWKVLFSFVILLVLGWIYKQYIHISITHTLLPSLITIIFAGIIRFLNQHILGLSAFWLTNTRAVVDFNDMIGVILSGRLFPLQYVAKVIPTAIITVLPYQYMIGFPTDVVLGKRVGSELLAGIMIQSFWVICYYILYVLLWRKGLQIYGGYGG